MANLCASAIFSPSETSANEEGGYGMELVQGSKMPLRRTLNPWTPVNCSEILLHVGVTESDRMTSSDPFQLVFNSYTKGAWGKEERQKNPVKKGDGFDIRIRAHDNKFTVSFNR
ncbi:galactoside-binding lectin, partial [Ancylostoma duodenale]